ncbi:MULTISPECIES: DUF1381 domain-containing protein [Staphylococcus]|uniref:DUF1381 domain-containing protein n=1 Tax=Staphylococcus TaxID=1279 RepID=UPI003F68CBB2
MTNYLIRHITDSTGHPFVEVIKPRENECYEIVSADSKEEAEKVAKKTLRRLVCNDNCNDKYLRDKFSVSFASSYRWISFKERTQ